MESLEAEKQVLQSAVALSGQKLNKANDSIGELKAKVLEAERKCARLELENQGRPELESRTEWAD